MPAGCWVEEVPGEDTTLPNAGGRGSTGEAAKRGPQEKAGGPALRFFFWAVVFGQLFPGVLSVSGPSLLIFQLQDLGHPPKELAGEMVSISLPRLELQPEFPEFCSFS